MAEPMAGPADPADPGDPGELAERGGPGEPRRRAWPGEAEGSGEPDDSGVIEAAGAVVWRHGPDGPEVLLIHRPRRDDWSLAKGKRDPGEQLPQTAVREVVEETGIRPILGGRLRSVSYLAGGRPKHVHYWAAAEPAPRAYPNVSFVPNHEVDEIEWL